MRTRTQSEPMSGAGYDMEKEQRRSEVHYASMEHAVALAARYYQRSPVPYAFRHDILGILTIRAQANMKRMKVGGDGMAQLMVHALPLHVIDECVMPPEPSVEEIKAEHAAIADALEVSEEEVMRMPPSSPIAVGGAACGGGDV